MKTKIVVIAAASLLTVGVGVHLSGHCPLREALHKSTAQVAAPKDAKAGLIAKK
jgi:hypothetical protein